jgi:hypothetical protein
MTADIAIEKPKVSGQPTIVVEDYHTAEAKSVNFGEVVGDSSPTNIMLPVDGEADSRDFLLQRFEQTWTNRLDREFDELADRAIAHELDASDKARFEYLTGLRRSLHHPRSVHEIIYEQERTEVLNGLLRALSKYVTFIGNGSTHQTRSTPKKKASAT